MSTYRYTPLDVGNDEIRLFHLWPGHSDDPIRISIVTRTFAVPKPMPRSVERLQKVKRNLPAGWAAHESLEGRIFFYNSEKGYTSWNHPNPDIDPDLYKQFGGQAAIDEPKYEALSYAWGSSEPRQAVEVVPAEASSRAGGRSLLEDPRTLKVGPNLHDALKSLRDPNTSRTLWIDAICINQEDAAEKGIQVRRMSDVFRFAQRVIVWLGPGSTHSSLAMRTLSHVGDQIEVATTNNRFHSPDCVQKTWWCLREASDITSDIQTWEAIFDLMCRPWFDRLWVVQEVCLANPKTLVQCGKDTTSWQRFRRGIIACDQLRYPRGAPPTLRKRIRQCVRPARSHDGPHPIELLRNMRHTLCSDPLDRIFGLLGLLPDALSCRLEVSYEKTPKEAWADFCIAYIECSGSLDMLTFAGSSWLSPHFNDEMSIRPWGMFCGANSVADVSHVPPKELRTTGLIYDTIEAVGYLSRNDDKDIDEMKKVWLNGRLPSSPYPVRGSLLQACTWTLMKGMLADKWTALVGDDLTLDQGCLAFQNWCENNKDNTIVERYPQLYASSLRTRGEIFRTSKGYFGIAIRGFDVGDKIGVLLGCPCPVILRPTSTGTHRFMECAYIHGIMDGEALLGPLPDEYASVIGDHDFQVFHNLDTGRHSFHDPRLHPLTMPWEMRGGRDPMSPVRTVKVFVNASTGEELRSDPRLLPDALRARGVPLETLRLV